MSMFDEMAGIDGGFQLTRRPLVILGEMMEALDKSSTAPYSAYGKTPKTASPSPNTRYRATPKPAFGKGKPGQGYKKQDDETPAAARQVIPVQSEDEEGEERRPFK